MARGRMLNNSVCGSKQFQDLPDDTCRLLATWLISLLDVQGVFHADPAMVKSSVFPRRTDVSIEQVAGYLDVLEELGLIVRYVADGDLWLHWPGFARNQVGLRTDRESPQFPAPPTMEGTGPEYSGEQPEECRNDDGELPAEEKLSEGKQKEHGRLAPPSKALTEPQRMFAALAKTCQVNLTTLTEEQRGALNQSERLLRKARASPADVEQFGPWWFANDWRGKKGEPPRPAQVREEWGKFTAWRDGGGRSSGGEMVDQIRFS